ncbi:hypothetical protein, partial [Herbiconiux daphne]
HGNIYEVSLVLSGANEGATIDYTNLEHSSEQDFENGEALIEPNFLIHSVEEEENFLPADEDPEEDVTENNEENITTEEVEELSHAATKGGTSVANTQETEDNRTIKDVLDTLNDDQKAAVAYLLANQEGGSDETAQQSDEFEGDETLKHSVFNDGLAYAEAGYLTEDGSVLTHGDANAILAQAATSKVTSLVDVFANAGISEDDLKHGISNIEALFPNTTAQGSVTVVNPKG